MAPLGVIAVLIAAAGAAAQASTWGLSPYRIRLLVAVDSVSENEQELAARIATHVEQRAESAVGAIWDLRVEAAPPGEARLAAQAIQGDAAARDTLVETLEATDKLMLAWVAESPRGVSARLVEYDATLLRWGRPQQAEVALLGECPESVFQLACDAFSPLAAFRFAQDDPNVIELDYRGAQLPSKPGAPEWVRAGDVFLPVLRRLDRDGAASAEGTREVPWTYLQVDASDGFKRSHFVSHTRRPLSSRKRGRVERIAIRLPRRSQAVTLRAHSRDDESTPLVGYQVFIQDGDDAKREPVGATGPDGRITIQPGESPVLMAYIKSGSQLVARLPVAPGGVEEMSIPLLDETPRLDAEAKLGILREDLIDLVARRKILIARINAAIEADKLDDAAKMVTEFERLPGRALFDRQLRQLEQSSTSDVPSIQKRIDRIFDDTRSVLAAFLNPREIQDLKNRLLAARN